MNMMQNRNFTIVLFALLISITTSSADVATPTDNKNRVWGAVHANAVMSVKAQREKYMLDQEIILDVHIKNTGDKKIHVMGCGGQMYDYRMALFDESGMAVAKSEKLLKAESMGDPHLQPTSSLYGRPISPGQTAFRTASMSDRFDIEKSGTYYLVVMRYLTSWNDGFLISNLAKIEIVDQDEEEPASTNNSSGH